MKIQIATLNFIVLLCAVCPVIIPNKCAHMLHCYRISTDHLRRITPLQKTKIAIDQIRTRIDIAQIKRKTGTDLIGTRNGRTRIKTDIGINIDRRIKISTDQTRTKIGIRTNIGRRTKTKKKTSIGLPMARTRIRNGSHTHLHLRTRIGIEKKTKTGTQPRRKARTKIDILRRRRTIRTNTRPVTTGLRKTEKRIAITRHRTETGRRTRSGENEKDERSAKKRRLIE